MIILGLYAPLWSPPLSSYGFYHVGLCISHHRGNLSRNLPLLCLIKTPVIGLKPNCSPECFIQTSLPERSPHPLCTFLATGAMDSACGRRTRGPRLKSIHTMETPVSLPMMAEQEKWLSVPGPSVEWRKRRFNSSIPARTPRAGTHASPSVSRLLWSLVPPFLGVPLDLWN